MGSPCPGDPLKHAGRLKVRIAEDLHGQVGQARIGHQGGPGQVHMLAQAETELDS